MRFFGERIVGQMLSETEGRPERVTVEINFELFKILFKVLIC